MLKVPTVISTKLGLGITSWNCRGLCSSLPYIADLLSAGCDILFLCETWLWPYDQYRLSEVHEDFESWGRADDRLDVAADKGRGYGGIGFLWKKSVAASPIGGIESDRVGGIRLALGDNSGYMLSIIAGAAQVVRPVRPWPDQYSMGGIRHELICMVRIVN